MLIKNIRAEHKISGGTVLTRAEAGGLDTSETGLADLSAAAERAGQWGCLEACAVSCALVDISNTRSDQGLDVRAECLVKDCTEQGIDGVVEYIADAAGIQPTD